MVKEWPIIFSGEMVRAILEGRKTQTRRPVKFPPHAYRPDLSWIKSVCQDGVGNWVAWDSDAEDIAEFTKRAYPDATGFPCPFGKVGDHLWVRETIRRKASGFPGIDYATFDADYSPVIGTANKWLYRAAWQPWPYKRDVLPSIHMPRWTSRITLEIIDVSVERVQDISEVDCVAEGIEPIVVDSGGFTPWDAPIDILDYRHAFAALWDSIYAKRGYGWDVNPWVWAIKYRRV